jgi:hypothetical protein
LGTRAHGSPGVHHRAGPNPGADVYIAGHHDDPAL